jgi:tetratricopeptide (TPR) repeat protein
MTISSEPIDPAHSPQTGREFYLEGLALGREGKHDEALIFFSRALELDPKMALAWAGRGFALGKLGRFEEEIECCKKAIEMDPYCVDAWNDMGS